MIDARARTENEQLTCTLMISRGMLRTSYDLSSVAPSWYLVGVDRDVVVRGRAATERGRTGSRVSERGDNLCDVERGCTRGGSNHRRLLMPRAAFRSDAPRTLRIVRPIMIGYNTLLSGPAETNKAY